jgi:hypothetical protein
MLMVHVVSVCSHYGLGFVGAAVVQAGPVGCSSTSQSLLAAPAGGVVKTLVDGSLLQRSCTACNLSGYATG